MQCPAPSTLSDARVAQDRYRDHGKQLHLLNLYPCAMCVLLALTAQAAYYRAEAELEASR